MGEDARIKVFRSSSGSADKSASTSGASQPHLCLTLLSIDAQATSGCSPSSRAPPPSSSRALLQAHAPTPPGPKRGKGQGSHPVKKSGAIRPSPVLSGLRSRQHWQNIGRADRPGVTFTKFHEVALAPASCPEPEDKDERKKKQRPSA